MEYLIPPHWFQAMSSPWLLVWTVLSILTLCKGADWLVSGAANLALKLGVPKVIVGATIVSLGTTSAECAVSVMAAWKGNPGLALGNAVGSVITDSGFIFGLGCLLVVLPADRFVLLRQGVVQISCATLLAVTCYVLWWMHGTQAKLGRGMGLFLLLLLAGYLFLSVRWARQHPAGEPFQLPEEEEPGLFPKRRPSRLSTAAKMLGILLAGLLLVIVSSHVLIQAVGTLAVRWGVPQVVIAGTLVAMGTSAPELVVAITSILRGHRDLLVGNVIGADILNVLFVTGAAAVAHPLLIVDLQARYPHVFLWLHLPTMLAILTLFGLFIAQSARRGQFRRLYGLPMLAIYIIYVAVGFLTSGPPSH